jgi:hypothetical protein
MGRLPIFAPRREGSPLPLSSNPFLSIQGSVVDNKLSGQRASMVFVLVKRDYLVQELGETTVDAMRQMRQVRFLYLF